MLVTGGISGGGRGYRSTIESVASESALCLRAQPFHKPARLRFADWYGCERSVKLDSRRMLCWPSVARSGKML